MRMIFAEMIYARNFKIGCGGKGRNNKKLSYGKVQMQKWVE
jgi:hypothetical protein